MVRLQGRVSRCLNYAFYVCDEFTCTHDSASSCRLVVLIIACIAMKTERHLYLGNARQTHVCVTHSGDIRGQME